MKKRLKPFLLFYLIAVLIILNSCSSQGQKVNLTHGKKISKATATVTVPKSTQASSGYNGNYTSLVDVSFVNLQLGFGLYRQYQNDGITGSNGSCSLSVSRTTDGGQTFNDSQKLIGQYCSNGSIDVGTDGVGIVYGSGLEITDNDGNTWFDTSFKNVVSATVFKKSIWVLWGECNKFSDSPINGVLSCNISYSSDGGNHWMNPVVVPNEATSDSAVQIAVSSQNTVYLLEEPQTGFSAILYSTVNNGASWSDLSTPACIGIGGGFDNAYLSISLDSTIWLACVGEPGAGNQLKSVTVSSDGGFSWSTCASNSSVFRYSGPWCAALGTAGYMGGIFGISNKMAVVFGGRNSLWITQDEGVTFRQVTSPPTMFNIMSGAGSGGVSFINAEDGWAIADPLGKGTLWQTTDGGFSWNQI